MIGFNHIGTMGRLGNQMFQHASTKGIARKLGLEYCIPPADRLDFQIDNYGLFEAFEMSNVDHVQFLNNGNAPVVQERHFHFDEELFTLCPDHVTLNGFFQTEKYFKHVEREIPVQPLDYYENALKQFSEDYPVLVFSDSIDWCKEQEIFKSDRFMFSEPEDKYDDGALVPYVDLCIMSLCSHAIIANSSLSWWGAWLQKNPNKKVIAPKMWFGPAYSQHNTKNLIPESWIVI